MNRGVVVRLRAGIAFAVLLAVCVAAPVLAADSPGPAQVSSIDGSRVGINDAQISPGPRAGGAAADSAQDDLPAEPEPPASDDGAIAEEIESVEREEVLRDQWLDGPEAIEERRKSRIAYDGLGAVEAESVLGSVFHEELKELDGDPARLLSDLDIDEVVGERAVLAVGPDGGTELVEFPIPVRGQVSDGTGGERRAAVDLALEPSGEGFAVKTPALAEIQLPSTLGGRVAVGDQLGFAALPGNPEVPATRYGNTDLFFPNTSTDTDTLVAPLSSGVEVLEQLRSPKSPEEFRFDLVVPEGGSVRPDGQGGAEILNSKGERVGSVPTPVATDAQGTDVPVSMVVEDASLSLTIKHRSTEVAYPILLDPTVDDAWYWSGGSTTGLGYWGYEESADYEGAFNCWKTCWGWGLYLRSKGEYEKGKKHWYGPSTWGRWVYTAPNSTAYIARLLASNLHGDVYNCATYQPHGYIGLWNGSGLLGTGTFSPLSFYSPSYDTGNVGNASSRWAHIGIGTAGEASQLGCAHDFYVGGTTIYQDDPENPGASVSGTPPAGKWISEAYGSFTINATGTDPGLGVRKITFTRDGSSPIYRPSENGYYCTGTAADRCLTSRGEGFTVSALSFDEGKRSASITVEDATGKKTTPPLTWNTYVDRTKPDLTLSGQLAVATKESGSEEKPPGEGDELSLPVYALTILATDEGKESNADAKKRSGVRRLEILVDKVQKKVWTQSCADSCKFEKTYELELNNLDAGDHELEVIATDGVEKSRERVIEFSYIPATGMKDEYTMHYFPLPDGSGDEEDEEKPSRPELSVNVVNGNLVYRQQDVDIPGYAADVEVERYYNSLLPEEENTEWGDGWTLAQTPDLEPEETEGAPTEAMMVQPSGAIEGSVGLPAEVGTEKFDADLQAVVTKEAGGRYVIEDATGETSTALAFDAAGKVDELRTEGSATIDYSYDGGALTEMTVKDAASSLEEPEGAQSGFDRPKPRITQEVSFGTTGTSAGELDTPSDVATDAQGNVWVLDRANNRVQKFSAAGNFLSQFGAPGSADGQFNSPSSLTIDAAGNLWVADSGNHRVQKFDASGQFLSKFGSFGLFTNGKFAYPNGIAIGPDGSIWVSDTLKLQRFTPGGEFIERIPGGAQPGQVSNPQGVSAGPDDKVYIAETGNHRVTVFDENGDFVRVIATVDASGEPFGPSEVEVDTGGNVFVTDLAGDQIHIFDEAGDRIAGFGGSGSGEGQLGLDEAAGISSDGQGRVWIADPDNDRVQGWSIARFTSTIFANAFGTTGTSAGELDTPSDVATDAQGNVWVLDRANNRVQKFSAAGNFLSQFGAPGSADGQFNSPSSLTIDAAGNLWVADAGNHRVQKFDASGQFLSKFGSFGIFTNGKFAYPNGIAIGPDGSIWVTDAQKVQRFTAGGEFIERVGTTGSLLGQVSGPQAVAAGPGGRLYVADSNNSRISVFDKDGEFARVIATTDGFGQPFSAREVEVDTGGNVFVTDLAGDQIHIFDEAGDRIAGFGGSGSGEGQLGLDEAAGVSSDAQGRVWIADPDNDRVQGWVAGHYESPDEEVPEDDPTVGMEVSDGLVTDLDAVGGEEPAEVSYEHDDGLLTAVDGPNGTTDYDYDEAGRMTRVELPNGTWAEIDYGATDGRVIAVTVAPAGGSVEETTFAYSDDPRKTTVTTETMPDVTYEIGEDGSVFKWKNALLPPEFEDVSGTLYDVENRETAAPINEGGYELKVQAYSEQGVKSIGIYGNGNLVLSEKTCTKVAAECKHLPDEWVTHTGSLAPGILNIEMVIEDFKGQVASKRFWANIPYTPEPPEGTPSKPRFADVLEFREDHGLDLDLDPIEDEFEINDRVFDTINDWVKGNPVAIASWERWGAPLRSPEVAELEYRLNYWSQASELIPGWAASNATGSFAGFYLDEPAGGKITVGFTGAGATSSLAALESALAPIVGADRVVAFPAPPKHTLASLEAFRAEVANAVAGYPSGLVRTVWVDVEANAIRVGASDVSQARSLLTASFGALAPIVVERELLGPVLKGRNRTSGMVRAGDELMMEYPLEEPGEKPRVGPCTAGFGAFERGKKPATGASVLRGFALTAAHCVEKNKEVWRRGSLSAPKESWDTIGEVRRSGFDQEGFDGADASAIRLMDTDILPRRIYQDEKSGVLNVHSIWTPTVGTRLCFTGRTSDRKRCGPVLSPPEEIVLEDYWEEDLASVGPSKSMCIGEFAWGGDSGGPVWVEGTGVAVGLVSYGATDPKEPGGREIYKEGLEEYFAEELEEEEMTPQEFQEELQALIDEVEEHPWFCMAVLKAAPGESPEGTIFGDPSLAPLHLVTATNAKG